MKKKSHFILNVKLKIKNHFRNEVLTKKNTREHINNILREIKDEKSKNFSNEKEVKRFGNNSRESDKLKATKIQHIDKRKSSKKKSKWRNKSNTKKHNSRKLCWNNKEKRT